MGGGIAPQGDYVEGHVFVVVVLLPLLLLSSSSSPFLGEGPCPDDAREWQVQLHGRHEFPEGDRIPRGGDRRRTLPIADARGKSSPVVVESRRRRARASSPAAAVDADDETG